MSAEKIPAVKLSEIKYFLYLGKMLKIKIIKLSGVEKFIVSKWNKRGLFPRQKLCNDNIIILSLQLLLYRINLLIIVL